MSARFVLVTKPSAPDGAAAVWPGGRRHPAADAEDAGTRTSWRLVGHDGVELGRGFWAFRSVDVCADASEGVSASAPALVARTAKDRERGEWAWRLELDGEPVVGAGRWYRTADECDRAVCHFLVALPWAVLTPYGNRSHAS